MFNPERLTLARCRRGLSKTKLASVAGLTLRSISAYEGGETEPCEENIRVLADKLGFPLEFFSRSSAEMPSSDTASFRALSSMTAAKRDTALAAGALAIDVSDWIGGRFNLPEPSLPELRGHSPEAAADSLREVWGLGTKPIKNSIHLLESKGVRIFSLVEQSDSVDAFSLWRNGTPFVFLNTRKSGERGRFDVCHELGHLVLHRHGAPQGREAELEADTFASSFLMPRGSLLASAPRLPSLDILVKLKRNWNVSVAALAHRMHALDLLSEWHYRTMCIEIAQRGFRRKEPNGIDRETSQVLNKVLQSLHADGVSRAVIARDLAIPVEDFEALVFGLVISAIPGGLNGPQPVRTRAHLRLV